MPRLGIKSETLVTLKPQEILPSVLWLSGSRLHVVWMTSVNVYPCPCLLLSPQVTSLQFILSVRIHSIPQESPSNCWDPAAPARNNIFYPLWIWVTQYHSTVHLFTNIYIIYIQPFIFQQHLTDSVTKQQCQTPVTVTSSDNQPADSLSHVDFCALKSIMSNTTPSIQLHCCWLIWDKPWRSKKTSVFGIIGVSVWLYSSPW